MKALFKKKWFAATLGIGVAIAITTFFGIAYFNDHAWGAWGDDSPGYVYLAARMFTGENLIYQDELAYQGLQFFGDEKLARWLTPTHHDFINTNGVLASRYPLGLSLIMYLAAIITGTTKSFYFVVPFMAAANIFLLYILSVVLFHSDKWKHAIGVLAGLSLGATPLYYTYALSQPMREIPSIFFVLLSAICIALIGHPVVQQSKKAIPAITVLTIATAAAFGMAINIRETSLVILPAFLVYIIMLFRSNGMNSSKKESDDSADSVLTVKTFIISTVVFIGVLFVALLPTIQNSYQLSQEKEVFKKRDTSEVVLLSNIDHIQTISFSNIFNSEGKYKPNKGSLPQYWEVLQDVYPVSYFLIFVLIGLVYGIRKYRKETMLLSVWIAGTLLIFSMWINPYSRYIMPLFPALFVIGAYGFISVLRNVHSHIAGKSTITSRLFGALLVLIFLFAYLPLISDMKTNITDEDVYRNKAIAEYDLDQLFTLEDIVDSSTKTPIFLFAGNWQYGISETVESHTGIKTIRYPLEQKFSFDEAQVQQFFNEYILPRYDMYIWVDPTVSTEYYKWIQSLEVDLIAEQQYSFQKDVRIYSIR